MTCIMELSEPRVDKTQFDQLPSDPVLTAILNGDEVDSDQGKCYFRLLQLQCTYATWYLESVFEVMSWNS